MINVTDGRRIRRKMTRRKVCEGVVFVCMRWLRRNEMEMYRWMDGASDACSKAEEVNSYNIGDTANEDRAGMQREW